MLWLVSGKIRRTSKHQLHLVSLDSHNECKVIREIPWAQILKTSGVTFPPHLRMTCAWNLLRIKFRVPGWFVGFSKTVENFGDSEFVLIYALQSIAQIGKFVFANAWFPNLLLIITCNLGLASVKMLKSQSLLDEFVQCFFEPPFLLQLSVYEYKIRITFDNCSNLLLKT